MTGCIRSGSYAAMKPPNNAMNANPDQAWRDRIHRPDTNLLVEAAAGTGKPRASSAGWSNCWARGNAASKPWRRSPSPARRRRVVPAVPDRPGKSGARGGRPARRRYQDALGNIERCFIGTIHSFCGRLLRERPVEAELDVAFEEIDAPTDTPLRQEVWKNMSPAFTPARSCWTPCGNGP